MKMVGKARKYTELDRLRDYKKSMELGGPQQNPKMIYGDPCEYCGGKHFRMNEKLIQCVDCNWRVERQLKKEV